VWRTLWGQITAKIIAYILGGVLTIVGSYLIFVLASFKAVFALKDVEDCVTNINDWLDHDNFHPEIFVTGWGGSLILTELVIKKVYSKADYHPPTYVLYDLPPTFSDQKYSKYGSKFISSSTQAQFFIPDAIKEEDKNCKHR
jgi:hypothetical protein